MTSMNCGGMVRFTKARCSQPWTKMLIGTRVGVQTARRRLGHVKRGVTGGVANQIWRAAERERNEPPSLRAHPK